MRMPLRRKILLYSSSVLVLLIVTMLVYVNDQAERFVNERIARDIQQGQNRILKAEEERLQSLGLIAFLVAELPYLRAGLEADTATVRDILERYEQQIPFVDLFILLNGSGNVITRTDTADVTSVTLDFDTSVLKTPGGTYHVAKVPVDVGGGLAGYVVAGALIDDAFATTVRNSTNDEIVIVDESILGSSLPRDVLPAQSRADWESRVGPGVEPRMVTIDNENYGAVATTLGRGKGARPLAVIMQSYDRAIAPYNRIQIGLLVLGIVAAITGIAISAVLARTITSPVAILVEGTRQVAAGNFDYRIDVHATDEIGDLSRSFNTMIQGLRERADMQRFVSLSTVEMIQSTGSKKISAGEKVVLTIFFSDMRGFTAMTQNWTPEETVRVVNTCLSLQAERVKKFHGDIDKYVGDCIVALFQGEDMALNAIRCAVETHHAFDQLNAAKTGDMPIRVGIGIVTGEVILGSIGGEDRLDYTVIGPNVNLCSRLCAQAGPGETLLGESTFARVKGLVAAEKLTPLQVKGFTDPIPVYRIG